MQKNMKSIKSLLYLLLICILLTRSIHQCRKITKNQSQSAIQMLDEETDEDQSSNSDSDSSEENEQEKDGGDDDGEADQSSKEDSAEKEDEDVKEEEEQEKDENDNDDNQNEEQEDEQEEEEEEENEDDEEDEEEEEKNEDEEEENDDEEEENDDDEEEEENDYDEEEDNDDDEDEESDEEEEDDENENEDKELEQEQKEDDEAENAEQDSKKNSEEEDEKDNDNDNDEKDQTDHDIKDIEENEDDESENQDDILKEKIQNWCNENKNYEEQGKFDDIIIKADFCLKQIDFQVEDQDQNKKQFNNARICINQIQYDDNLIKEDFMRLTFCFQYDYLKLQEYESQEISPVVKTCFEKYQMEYDQMHLAFIEQIQEMCEGSTKYSSIEQCVFSISGLDSAEQQQGISVYNCIKNRSDQHNDIYPTCYQMHYNSFDEVHEQFNELVELNCSDELDEVIQTKIASAELSQKVTKLKQCINDIQTENQLPKDQYLEVADCYQRGLEELQFNFLSKNLKNENKVQQKTKRHFQK
ncbi:hypothetical protein TTHERM_00194310 (macronuclear) [Tetrahymena thermophila SB210]|uniref:Transmembrane protein n=1 Tax=Tetrahymena thermophila (strain SB210) TaxID=312017 RepID=Q23KA4_TETTS|nr:hypothetical protein TTHERM_00194310 [Tetrahymena thermophila SB210]EAR96939.2 hypothetical protein TTHERM_00194310 [Tetrahymena thermophila SB210]|eukprot:XP_001017184.2 hypothetical protein TTHERM_00194310 [Tetrahymena thermophila SB210]